MNKATTSNDFIPITHTRDFIIILIGLSYVILAVLDKSVTDITMISEADRMSSSAYFTFIFLSITFFVLQIPLFVLIIRARKTIVTKQRLQDVFYYFSLGLQFFLLVNIVAIIVQMYSSMSYDILFVRNIIIFSYYFGLACLSISILRFFRWYFFRKKTIILLFAVSLVLLSISIFLDTSRTVIELSFKPKEITPQRSPLGFYSSGFGEVGIISTSITALAFGISWLAVALLLHSYESTFGRFKYWILISLPLVYYVSQFEFLFTDLLYPLRLSNPFMFNMYYTLVFSSALPIGGILFGLSFWTITRKIILKRDTRRYLLLSSIGFMLIFSSIDPGSIRLAPYPPFGVSSAAIFGLSSFIFLIGLYNTAISISLNTGLRKELRKHLEFSMFDTIGLSELEERMKKQVENFKRIDYEYEVDHGAQASLEGEELSRYLQEVLEEVSERRKRW